MLVAAAENERRRLSGELRDLLQTLVALKIKMKLLADETDDEERERARERIADEIHDTVRGLKRTIRGLLPPQLDRSRGLSSALHSIFRDIRDVYGLTVHARLDQVGGELDPVAALALYRIVQEAVTNVVRHAAVDEATVTLSRGNGTVTVTIRDEGCGFDFPDPGTLPGDGGTGLAGMRERATLVGGTFAVRASPGKGTTVRASVPTADREPEGE